MMIELNKIYNEDCIKGMQEMQDGSVDLICSDPPYCISYKTNRRKEEHRFNDVILNDDNYDLIRKYLQECYRILKDNSAAYIFCSSKTLPFFMETAKDAGFTLKNIIIWDKGSWTSGDLEAQYGQSYEPCLYLNKGRRSINGKRLSDIWRFPRVVGDAQVHQNQKPLNLIRQCILKSSEEGDIVFDGFMGSGTTAVAAFMEKRYYIGYELDEGYYNICMKRIKDETLSQMTLW